MGTTVAASTGGIRATRQFAAALIAMSVRSALAERGAFLMRAALMAVNNGIFFTFWIVLFSRVPTIRGYQLGDMAVLYGIVAIAHGLAVFFAGGMEHLARVIHDGELDAFLAQPKPTLPYVLGMRSQPSGLGDIASGMVMIGLSDRLSVAVIPLAVIAAIAGALVLVATAVILHSSAFWLGQTDTASRQLYESTLFFSLYPDTLFVGPVRVMLFTILPAGFVGYFPASIIRAPTLWAVVTSVSAATAYILAASWIFRRGLRSYSSGSRFANFA